MITNASNDKEVPVLLLEDKWLIFCLPVFILNVVVYLLHQAILRPYFYLLDQIARFALRKLGAKSLVNIPALLLVNFVSQAGIFWLSAEATNSGLLGLFLVVINIVTAMMSLVAIAYAAENYLGVRTDLVFAFSSLDNPSKDSSSIYWPKGLEIEKLSRGVFLRALMVTVLVLCNIGFMFAAETFSPVFWVSIHSLVLVAFLVDFEVSEHLAAHSSKGRLASLNEPGIGARLLYALEILRKYIVWPLHFFLPNAYYFLHTYHHHFENNGPADWQSTLRFDQSSFLDFIKSLNMLLFSMFFPVDTYRYLTAMNRLRMRRKLIAGCAMGYLVILLIGFIEPMCLFVLLLLNFGRGWVIHQFIFAWHGFHDATKPYNLEVSNNSSEHYAHHKKPGVHILSEEILTVPVPDDASRGEKIALHKPDIGYYMLSEHWLLIQALLWQRKFGIIRQLIDCDHLTDNELHRLVSGSQLLTRKASVSKIDRYISNRAGRLVEAWASIRLTSEQRKLVGSVGKFALEEQ